MADGRHIVLIDPDARLRQALAEQLRALGHETISVSEAAAALAPMQQAAPDLLLLAGAPSDMGAEELCRAWRARNAGAILALAADPAEADRLSAAGADLCLLRPVRLAELGRAIARALAARPGAALSLGARKFDPSTRLLDDGLGGTVRLTEKEAAILARLCREPGRTVPRQELLDQVWGYAGEVTTHTLETHVYRLRRKLGQGKDAPARLIGEGGGYRLELGGEDSPSSAR